MLGEKDEVLIEYLMHDCRTPISTLSKVTKLTKPTVLYRIQKLEKNKIIEKYDALLNYNILKFKPKVLFLSIKNSKKEEFEKEMKNFLEVETLFYLYHRKNYVMWLVFKNKIQEKIFFKKIKTYTDEFDLYQFKQIRFMPFSIFSFDLDLKLKESKIKEREIKLDNTDLELLKKLADGHGKDSILDLSQTFNINYHTLLYKFKRLFKNGYFLKFLAQTNVNLTQNDIIILEIDNLDFKQIYNKLKQLSKVPFLSQIDENKFYIQILSSSINQYKKTIGDINNLFQENLKHLEVYNMKKSIVLNRYPFEFLKK